MPVVFDEVEGTVDHPPEERVEPDEAEGHEEPMSPARILDELRKLEQRQSRLRAD